MKKLRFKNRNGVLYFGIDGNFKSSKMKYNVVNKNILIGKHNRGELNDALGFEAPKSILLCDLVRDVLDRKSIVLKYQSIQSYNTIFRTKIIPFFDKRTVTEIKPSDIKKFHDMFIEQGLGNDSIRIARVLLSEAFANAILNEIIVNNPILMVRMPKARTQKKKQLPCTLKEIDDLLRLSKQDIKNFLGISFFTGMRSGELLALKWEDIDFDTDTISINKTISKGIINSPKTRSSLRDIEMIPQAREFFKSQYLQTGLKKSYVFLNSFGNYYGQNNYFQYSFKGLLKELNLEDRSLHNTRHTFASMMLNNGIDPLWVSNTLGHETLDITLKVNNVMLNYSLK